ncbi:hypothetical protein ASF61_13030 [Duganella sp. Leaf126]|uniref:alpha/beta hydrolase family protein n=1 Tax=Duganella sp. Leaf126 TaxID=1736266 RepID=UPI000713C3C1|nr:alpha/beta hydrolase [Duganella sp. Leaf126]KQQ33001.1 hypothetical protein ASF61_13030 [Duganella sp. Leaf126]
MTRRFLANLLLSLCGALAATSALAARVYDESTIRIDGKSRRYYHLYDSAAEGTATPIVLVSGSGCRDFASRVPSFFEHYPAPINLYFLEKAGIEKGDDGAHCSETYSREDVLERRVGDTLSFIDVEPQLHSLAPRSLAIVGFSEGGTVAPLAAAGSAKIGWLAVAGSGGLPQSEEFLIFAARGVAPYATLFSRAQLLRTYAAIKADPESLDKRFFGHPYRYWRSHLFYDPLPTYAKLDIPVVVAMGEKDDSVPIESGRKLHAFFASRPGNKFTFVEYPGAGHALQAPERNYLPQFIAGLAEWIKGKRNPF